MRTRDLCGEDAPVVRADAARDWTLCGPCFALHTPSELRPTRPATAGFRRRYPGPALVPWATLLPALQQVWEATAQAVLTQQKEETRSCTTPTA